MESGLDAGWRQNSLRVVVLDTHLRDLAAPHDEVVNLALALKWCPVCSALLNWGRPVKNVFSDAARRGERPAHAGSLILPVWRLNASVGSEAVRAFIFVVPPATRPDGV